MAIHTRGDFLFAENYTDEVQTVSLKEEYADTESGERLKGEITLDAFGVRILRKLR